MPEITANGCRFYYELDGAPDGDVLVLSNGILMSTASWGYQAPAFCRRYRLLRYDCRGQWQSEHPAGPYSMEGHADDLAALLDALGIEKAHIAGISYGAELSMIFAYKYPERTRTLVVSSAVSQVDPVLAGICKMWLAAAERRDPELFFAATYPFNFSERWIAANPGPLAAARERYKSLDFDAVAELCRAFLHLHITAELPRITAPALIMVGEDDNLKPRAYAEIIARQVQHAAYAIIPHAGHAVCWEAPLAFNSLVLGFLDQQEKGGGSGPR
jgi:3-oxoadipate enol-lactonase